MPVLERVLSYVERALGGAMEVRGQEAAPPTASASGTPARLEWPVEQLRQEPSNSAPSIVPGRTRLDASLSEAEAMAIHERWKSRGGYEVSDSGRCRMTYDYQAWRRRVDEFLLRPPEEVRGKVDGWRRWLSEHENHARWQLLQRGMSPKPPGPGVAELAFQLLEGEPLGWPPAEVFRQILVYNIKLPEGGRYSFHDDPVLLDSNGPSHESGVSRIGVKIHKRKEFDALLTHAGISDATERKVFRKIAQGAGGFEAINTAHEGAVTVGFVPFSSGETGDGPLCRLLRSLKSASPSEFQLYFRGLGIDVSEKELVVVHLDHEHLLRGREAVHAIRDDKRLSAVFQHAGEKCRAYQLTQLKLARELYYLASHDFAFKTMVRSGNRALMVSLSGRYGDVLLSEAGKVAIMDRAVHRGVGNARQTFKEACVTVVQEKGINTVGGLAEYEGLIVPVIQTTGRLRVLDDAELSQPATVPML